MIYVFDCFPWILRFNIGPARENRDRVYVTDAKCPHQGGVSKPKKQPFWSPSKNGLSDKRWRKYRKIYIIYIYRKMMRNDGKMMGSHVCPILHRFTHILTWCHAYLGLLFWDDENSPQWQRSWQFGLRLMAGYRSISMARHRLVTWRPPMLGLQGLQWIELSSGNQHIQQLCSARS